MYCSSAKMLYADTKYHVGSFTNYAAIANLAKELEATYQPLK